MVKIVRDKKDLKTGIDPTISLSKKKLNNFVEVKIWEN